VILTERAGPLSLGNMCPSLSFGRLLDLEDLHFAASCPEKCTTTALATCPLGSISKDVRVKGTFLELRSESSSTTTSMRRSASLPPQRSISDLLRSHDERNETQTVPLSGDVEPDEPSAQEARTDSRDHWERQTKDVACPAEISEDVVAWRHASGVAQPNDTFCGDARPPSGFQMQLQHYIAAPPQRLPNTALANAVGSQAILWGAIAILPFTTIAAPWSTQVTGRTPASSTGKDASSTPTRKKNNLRKQKQRLRKKLGHMTLDESPELEFQ
jgi:hypothetical protein